MSKEIIFKGCGTALITPFCENKIDFTCFEKLIKFQIKNKADAIIVGGTTGESPTLKDYEKIMLIDAACKIADGNIPVIAGTGSNDTTHAVYLSQEAEKAGADALLIVTPYYNKTSQYGLVKHYEKIASSVNIPCIVYNIPQRTGLDISTETYRALSEIPNINAVKEASGNISKIANIVNICRDELYVYSGNDDQTEAVLSVGGMGVISVASNIIPYEMHKICELYFHRKNKESTEMQLNLLKFINVLFTDVNPMPIKYAMSLLGICSDESRAPLCELSEENKEKVKKVISEYNFSDMP